MKLLTCQECKKMIPANSERCVYCGCLISPILDDEIQTLLEPIAERLAVFLARLCKDQKDWDIKIKPRLPPEAMKIQTFKELDLLNLLKIVKKFHKVLCNKYKIKNLYEPADSMIAIRNKYVGHRPASAFLRACSEVYKDLKNILEFSKMIKIKNDTLQQIKVLIHKVEVATENPGNNRVSNIKVVVFDFDGTLTTNKDTIWEMLWVALGYDITECQKHYGDFIKKRKGKPLDYDQANVLYQKWCELTEEEFKKKNCNKSHLESITTELELIDDVEEVFVKLQKSKVKIYILSGSIKSIIQQMLGNNLIGYLEEILANEFLFDENNYLTRIRGTRYEFEGKAKFIQDICEQYKILPSNVLYVGNSINDEYIKSTGAKTLCINPLKTNPYDESKWSFSEEYCTSLKKILEYAKIK